MQPYEVRILHCYIGIVCVCTDFDLLACSCRKCRYEFCWICMQDWSLHNSATGGFFQCNRFVVASDTASGPADNDGEFAAFVDEYGNAQAESLRRRRHAQKVARFIHHFTRFQAHGDSQRMEKKMHKDTIARIVTSLVKSAQGEIHWPLKDIQNPLLSDSSYANPTLMKELFSAFGEGVAHSMSNVSNVSGSGPAVAVHATPQKEIKEKKKSSIIGALVHTVAKGRHHGQSKHAASASTPSLEDQANNAANSSAGHGNEMGGIRLECISFLNNGFDELSRCRLVGP
jgi:hypothetical protein